MKKLFLISVLALGVATSGFAQDKKKNVKKASMNVLKLVKKLSMSVQKSVKMVNTCTNMVKKSTNVQKNATKKCNNTIPVHEATSIKVAFLCVVNNRKYYPPTWIDNQNEKGKSVEPRL